MKFTKTTLMESSKKIIVHFALEGEPGDTDQKNMVLLDPSQDFDPTTRDLKPTMNQIWSSLMWFDVFITYDNLQPLPAWILARDTSNYYDFRYFGGIKDRSGIDGTPNRVLISTNGFENGHAGTFIIEFKKD